MVWGVPCAFRGLIPLTPERKMCTLLPCFSVSNVSLCKVELLRQELGGHRGSCRVNTMGLKEAAGGLPSRALPPGPGLSCRAAPARAGRKVVAMTGAGQSEGWESLLEVGGSWQRGEKALRASASKEELQDVVRSTGHAPAQL